MAIVNSYFSWPEGIWYDRFWPIRTSTIRSIPWELWNRHPLHVDLALRSKINTTPRLRKKWRHMGFAWKYGTGTSKCVYIYIYTHTHVYITHVPLHMISQMCVPQQHILKATTATTVALWLCGSWKQPLPQGVHSRHQDGVQPEGASLSCFYCPDPLSHKQLTPSIVSSKVSGWEIPYECIVNGGFDMF